jgi:hypothetical protein
MSSALALAATQDAKQLKAATRALEQTTQEREEDTSKK